MDRRSLLRGVGTLVAGGLLAGCTVEGEVPPTAAEPPAAVREATPERDDASVGTVGGDPDVDGGGPVDEAESGNSITLLGQDSVPDDDGGLVVTITVGNEGENRSQALVEVDIRNDERVVIVTVDQYVDLAPGETTTLRFTPEVTYEQYGSHEPRILAETPATPLPTDTATPTPTATATPTPTPTEADDTTASEPDSND